MDDITGALLAVGLVVFVIAFGLRGLLGRAAYDR